MPTSLGVLPDQQAVCEKPPAFASQMDYFRSRLGADQTIEWLRKKKAVGLKVIGLPGWSVPVEIVLAAGGVPVRLSGIWEEAKHFRRELPRDICPLAASFFLGAESLSREGLLDVAVVPGTCDWKRKLNDLLAEDTKVLTLQAPPSENLGFLSKDLRNFAREIALITDLPVVSRNLKFASAEIARVDEAFAALHRLRRHPTCALSGEDALAVEEALMRDDLSRWTERCRTLIRLLEEESAMTEDSPSDRAPRIFLAGSPVIWDRGNLVHLIEKAGGKVVCNDFHSCLTSLYAPEISPARDDVAFSTLPLRWARSCFCSAVGEDEGLIFRAIEDFRVEGVVGHTYRACGRLQMRMSSFLRRARDSGIPSLAVETEGDSNDTERLLTRIEAFIEMLFARRRSGA
ncbi:2-hydroxyacyl-CoA dehydratase [bacterium]|nr:2-hydroxyacyl-CoA dehydratase [bacterium]